MLHTRRDLGREFTRHHVLVDSRDRDFDVHPAPTTYRIRLPRSYKNVVAARVLSADVPSSFFVFSAARGNTALKVNVGDSTQVVTIADGNYGVASLCAELRAAFLDAFPTKSFAIDVDPRTMQLTLGCSQGDVVAVDTTEYADANPTDWGLAYYLGFPRGEVTAGTPDVRGPGMVNVNPATYVLLDIAELGRVDEGAPYSGGGVGKGAFCKIPLNASVFEYIFKDLDTATELVDCKPAVPRLDTLTVTWRFHDGSPVDFRGVEHSFMIELIVREPQSLPSFSASHAQAPKRARQPPRPPPPAQAHAQAQAQAQAQQEEVRKQPRSRTVVAGVVGVAALAGILYWVRHRN
jgi:hypothetical protein